MVNYDVLADDVRVDLLDDFADYSTDVPLQDGINHLKNVSFTMVLMPLTKEEVITNYVDLQTDSANEHSANLNVRFRVFDYWTTVMDVYWTNEDKAIILTQPYLVFKVVLDLLMLD